MSSREYLYVRRVWVHKNAAVLISRLECRVYLRVKYQVHVCHARALWPLLCASFVLSNVGPWTILQYLSVESMYECKIMSVRWSCSPTPPQTRYDITLTGHSLLSALVESISPAALIRSVIMHTHVVREYVCLPFNPNVVSSLLSVTILLNFHPMSCTCIVYFQCVYSTCECTLTTI